MTSWQTLAPDDINGEFKIRIACECYSDLHHIREALAGLSDLGGYIEWSHPRSADPTRLVNSEFVLIFTDELNLFTAIGRAAAYRYLEQAHLLIYMRDEGDTTLPSEAIPGLVVARAELQIGLLQVFDALLEPLISPGLMGVDWADTRNILTMDGKVELEKAYGNQPEEVIRQAIGQLKDRVSGRAVYGLQASIICNPAKLATRHPAELLSTCRDCFGEESTIIVAAPLLDWPDEDYCEVRLFARVACSPSRQP